jgi:hypothetical protein
LRYGLALSTVIVDRRARFSGSEFETASEEIARLLEPHEPTESKAIEQKQEV